MKVVLLDSRTFVGYFKAFDKHMNILLCDCEELRRIKPKPGKKIAEGEEKRTLGLVLLRGEHIVSMTVQSNEQDEDSKQQGKAGNIGGPGAAKPAGRGMGPPMVGPPGPAPGLQGAVRGIGGPGMGMMQPQPMPGAPPFVVPQVFPPRGPMQDSRTLLIVASLVAFSADPRYLLAIERIMAPKKKDNTEDRPPLMGRVGTNLKMGILGVPNVGKSTFFNVLTKSQAQAENFPFCTIDPNEKHFKPVSKVPAFLSVVDIAGLVSGASEGLGLGNAFLSHVSACDALFHLCRAFDDENVTHVEGDVNPVRDLSIIQSELIKKDLQYLEGAIDKLEKVVVRGGDKSRKLEYETLLKVRKLLEEDGQPVRLVTWNEKEVEVLNHHLLLTAKPIVYLINLSDTDYIRKKNKWLAKIKTWLDVNDPHAVCIPFSGTLELKLMEMPEDERVAFLKAQNATRQFFQYALDKIVKTGYKALQLEYFFTCGKDEVKAWTIQKGTKAPQAAGKIHTDFERGFIMAEVCKVEDLMELGSENAVKAAGKYRQQGRNYVVEDGDIVLFKFNAGAGLTTKKK
uniref:Obg-like ATPase 1 n=2 Tax=Filarioidea TaxID=6295 RepID=A0A915PHT1_9BILA